MIKVKVVGAGGFGGAGMIELPAGDVQTLTLVSSLVPDDPVASATGEVFVRPRTHLRVTPRWGALREAP